ncbi:conserved hypothetical protein [Gammaproteobacteria bacterium]
MKNHSSINMVNILTRLFHYSLNRYSLCFIFILLDSWRMDASADSNSCIGDSIKEIPKTWYDQSHAYLSKKFCEPAAWFDNFFSNERSDEERGAGSFVRWRNEFSFANRDGSAIRSQLSAKIELPNLNKRLHLLLFREDEDDTISMLTDNPKSSFTTNSADTSISQRNRLNLGLRYNFSEGVLSHFSLSGGVRAGTPLKPFVKGRYRHTQPLSEKSLARFTETVYWKNIDGFGETSHIDLEHQLTKENLLRWSNHATISELSRGVDLGSELSLLHQINERKAISFNIGAWGYTQPATFDSVTINTRFRHNIYRGWFFYEIEPAISWPRDEQGKRNSVSTITFRFEVQFERY